MRAIVTGLVAWGALLPAGVASAATQWVVLRVERVEVAVARADGSPWDEADPNGSQAAPDLAVRLAIDGDTAYVSSIAIDRLSHELDYDILVPMALVPADGLTIEVFDQDGIEIRRGEPLGTIELTSSDIGELVARSSRVKTFSDDSVTRLEISARRYARSSRRRTARLGPGSDPARLSPSAIAGELVEVRASSVAAIPTVIVGVAQDRLAIGRCTRALITSSGEVTATVEDASATGVEFELRVLPPSLAMWRRGHGWVPCDGRKLALRSIAAVAQTRTSNGSTLDPSAVAKIIKSRYLAGVARCHERLLLNDPMASGRIDLRFRVGPTGGIVKATATGFESTLGTCIESLAARWRFSAPKDAQGDPTSEDVHAEILLDAR